MKLYDTPVYRILHRAISRRIRAVPEFRRSARQLAGPKPAMDYLVRIPMWVASLVAIAAPEPEKRIFIITWLFALTVLLRCFRFDAYYRRGFANYPFDYFPTPSSLAARFFQHQSTRWIWWAPLEAALCACLLLPGPDPFRHAWLIPVTALAAPILELSLGLILYRQPILILFLFCWFLCLPAGVSMMPFLPMEPLLWIPCGWIWLPYLHPTLPAVLLSLSGCFILAGIAWRINRQSIESILQRDERWEQNPGILSLRSVASDEELENEQATENLQGESEAAVREVIRNGTLFQPASVTRVDRLARKILTTDESTLADQILKGNEIERILRRNYRFYLWIAFVLLSVQFIIPPIYSGMVLLFFFGILVMRWLIEFVPFSVFDDTRVLGKRVPLHAFFPIRPGTALWIGIKLRTLLILLETPYILALSAVVATVHLEGILSHSLKLTYFSLSGGIVLVTSASTLWALLQASACRFWPGMLWGLHMVVFLLVFVAEIAVPTILFAAFGHVFREFPEVFSSPWIGIVLMTLAFLHAAAGAWMMDHFPCDWMRLPAR